MSKTQKEKLTRAEAVSEIWRLVDLASRLAERIRNEIPGATQAADQLKESLAFVSDAADTLRERLP